MNANLEAIKQEIIAGAEGLSSSKEVYEFKKLFLDGKTGKIGLLMKEMKNIPNEEKAAYGKIDKKILKALFKVCYDDIEYEIAARTNYIEFLRKDIKRIRTALTYYEKMKKSIGLGIN